MSSLTRIHLTTTSSHAVMNLAMNLDREHEALHSPEYKDFVKKTMKQKTLAVLRGRPFQPMFDESHYIRPQLPVDHAE